MTDGKNEGDDCYSMSWRIDVVFIDPDFIGFYRGFIVILTSVRGFNGFAVSQSHCLSTRYLY